MNKESNARDLTASMYYKFPEVAITYAAKNNLQLVFTYLTPLVGNSYG